jgi:hypothetical protein
MDDTKRSVTKGRLSGARGAVGDVAMLARSIPVFPVERIISLGGLAEVRAALGETPSGSTGGGRIGWAAIFLKAYALVARDMPVLRSWFVGRLVPRLATCSESVATLAVNRVEEGEDRLFFARLPRPDDRSLPQIQQFIADCQTKPVDEVFRRQLELEMVPGFLRRAILRWNMHSFSPKRAGRIGTFSLSTLSGFNATNRLHPTICTTSLSYAPLDADGRCLVTLLADHRVLDGATAARALARLEEVLRGAMVEEITSLGRQRRAAA